MTVPHPKHNRKRQDHRHPHRVITNWLKTTRNSWHRESESRNRVNALADDEPQLTVKARRRYIDVGWRSTKMSQVCNILLKPLLFKMELNQLVDIYICILLTWFNKQMGYFFRRTSFRWRWLARGVLGPPREYWASLGVSACNNVILKFV